MKRVVVLLMTAAYIAWPLDLIADIIPIFGHIDDVIVGVAGLYTLFARGK